LIADARPLDLDYIGAKVAKEHGAIGTGQRLGKFHHANSVKNVFHGYRAGL
jgi:hypothetical protein